MSRTRAWLRMKMGWIPRPVRRVIVSVIGGTLLLLALAGMILPIMPGVIFIPFALAILAVEFAWAARWLKKLKKTAGNMHQRVKDRWYGTAATPPQAADDTQAKKISPADDASPPRRNAAA